MSKSKKLSNAQDIGHHRLVIYNNTDKRQCIGNGNIFITQVHIIIILKCTQYKNTRCVCI